MRDKRFVAQHRGGPLDKANHRKLMKWARECSEHVLSLLDNGFDQRLAYALHIAKAWENENASVGEAMKASLGAHAVARESTDSVLIAVARSIGQAVATAHMADHSLGGALYALKAVKLASRSVENERTWQNKQIEKMPEELVELVLLNLEQKLKSFKLG